MSGPQRIQRKRTAGWRMPHGAVYVGRPSRWGNPFRVERVPVGGDVRPRWAIRCTVPQITAGTYYGHEDLARAAAVALFELHTGPMGAYEYDDTTLVSLRTRLGGRDLACWCPLTGPCHADALLTLANPAVAS